jgi:hypothetical protein
VRAVGNFVRLITENVMKESNFRESNDKAIAVLVHNATTGNNMKVWKHILILWLTYCILSFITAGP